MPTMPEADRRKVFEARLPTSVWPSRPLKVTAVEAQTGELAVFDSAGDAACRCGGRQLRGARTLAAGHHRRTPFHGRRHAHVANADLAHGYERVVIVAPVAAGIGFMAARAGRRPR